MVTQEDKDALLYKLLENGLLKGPISSRSMGRVETRKCSINHGRLVKNRFLEFSAIDPTDKPIVFVVNSIKVSG